MSIDREKRLAFPRGVFTRCIGETTRKSIIYDMYSQTSYKAKPKVLIEGNILSYQVTNSFSLHGGDTNELIDFQVISRAHKAIIITILLKGKLNFSYDNLSFDLNTNEQQIALVVNLTKPVRLIRNIYQDNHVVKLHVSVPINWIESRSEANDKIRHFISQHLAYLKLNLSPKLIALSQKLILLHSPSYFLEKMEVETLTQSLLLEVFKQLDSNNNSSLVNLHSEPLDVRHSDKVLDHLIAYIEEHIEQTISTTQLVEVAGMSLSSLQRKFKRGTGYSINNYIRIRRLEIAKQQLERGASSITKLAYSAGYRYPSNFTNAFKKTFGYAPQDVIKKQNSHE